MIFSIVLTIIIFTLIINFTGGEEFSLWVALGLLYILHFSNKNAQIDKLREDVELLKKQISDYAEKPVSAKQPVAVKPENAAAVSTKTETAKPTKAFATVQRTVVSPQPKPAAHKESDSSFWGQNLIVWIAGFAAILGAFYLIRYSVEHGFLGPRVRFALMTLFGLALTFTGYCIYGIEDFANNKRIGQSLTGAGLATLYFAAYAVSEIYHFTSQGVSLVWMCVVTGMAVILTIIRGGRPIALLTMLGAFLTPALVGNEQASPCFFSLYMLLFTGVFAWMAVEMVSILLLLLTICGLYLWGFYWLFWGAGTLISFWQMTMFFGATAIFLQAHTRLNNLEKNTILPVLAIFGCFFFGFGYVIRMQFGIMEWAVIGVMTAGLAALTFKDAKSYLPLLGCSIIAGLVIWLLPQHDKSLFLFAGYTAVALLPFYASLWVRIKAEFAGYVGVFALLFYAAYCYLFKQTDLQTFVGLAGAVLLLLPLLRCKLDTEELQQAAGIVISSAAIMAAIALAKTIAVDILPIIAAGGVLMFAALRKICKAKYMLSGWGMAFVWFVYLQIKPIFYLLSFLIIGSVWDMRISADAVSFANILTHGVIPLLCFGGAMFMLPKGEARRVMFFSTAVLGMGLLFSLYAKLVMLATASSFYRPSLTVNAIITDLMIASYWFVVKKNGGSPVLSRLGFWRLGLACLALLFGVSGARYAYTYGSTLISFGVPIALFIWFARLAQCDKDFLGKCALVVSFYFVTVLVTITLSDGETVRLFARRLTDSGLFAYSAGWMLLGICWLVAAKFAKEMTKPAFALIYFVIAKVFLYDVAELSDFWRIIALFALAGCLLGIGHFHARFFSADSKD